MAYDESIPTKNVAFTGRRVKPTCPKCNVLLVNNKCPKCDYVRVLGYDKDPERDMTGHGFAKAVTFKHLNVNPEKSTVTITEVDYYVRDFPCFNCETDRFVWLCPQRTGVYKSCLRCGMSTGPISQENGITRKTYEVTPQEALKILEKRLLPDSMLRQLKNIVYDKKYVEPRKRPKAVK